MTRLKSKRVFWLLLLSLLHLSAAGQDGKDTALPVTLRVSCNGAKATLAVPEIEAYDQVTYTCLAKSFFSIHYASDFVATIDLVVQKTGNVFAVRGILWYAPCQTCEDGRTEIYTLYERKPLAYFNKTEVPDYIAKKARKAVYLGDAGNYDTRFRNFVRKIIPGYKASK